MTRKEELMTPTSCINKAGNDEMIFVLRAKDAAAPVAIEAWIQERIRLGLNTVDDDKIRSASECAYIMEQQRAGIR